ncbi:hypothetical protein GCM10028808_08900 [Spirosoma migulaei]
MNTKEYEDEQLIQSNRHLGEWASNTTLEIEARYVMGGKHRDEHRCLALEKDDPSKRGVLLARHLAEILGLKLSNSTMRLAIEERHSQERYHLNELFV